MLVKLLSRYIFKKKSLKSHFMSHCYHIDHNDLVTNISLIGIKRILRQNNIAFLEGHACISMNCPICETNKCIKNSKIYINKTTGKLFKFPNSLLITILYTYICVISKINITYRILYVR